MKEKILQLRKQGKTYKEIKQILGCSKGTIAYYCGVDQKEKTRNRTRKLRLNNTLSQKIDKFKNKNNIYKIRDFQRRENGHLLNKGIMTFTIEDVLKKIGNNPTCYLSGEKLDISDSKNFSLDHIVPASRGGSNTLDNLDIVSSIVNQMKHNLTIEEFLNKCIQILRFNGYKIEKL